MKQTSSCCRLMYYLHLLSSYIWNTDKFIIAWIWSRWEWSRYPMNGRQRSHTFLAKSNISFHVSYYMGTSKRLRERTAVCDLEHKFWSIGLSCLTVNVPQMRLRCLDGVNGDTYILFFPLLLFHFSSVLFSSLEHLWTTILTDFTSVLFSIPSDETAFTGKSCDFYSIILQLGRWCGTEFITSLLQADED